MTEQSADDPWAGIPPDPVADMLEQARDDSPWVDDANQPAAQAQAATEASGTEAQQQAVDSGPSVDDADHSAFDAQNTAAQNGIDAQQNAINEGPSVDDADHSAELAQDAAAAFGDVADRPGDWYSVADAASDNTDGAGDLAPLYEPLSAFLNDSTTTDTSTYDYSHFEDLPSAADDTQWGEPLEDLHLDLANDSDSVGHPTADDTFDHDFIDDHDSSHEASDQ